MTDSTRFDELAMAAWWRDHQAPLRMVDAEGHTWEVIHRGAWSHGHGPDFVDAMLLIDDRELVSGAVEFHLQANGWYSHGHHLDPAYDSVVLHLVAHGEPSRVRLNSGGTAPTLVFPASNAELAQHRDTNWLSWSVVGGEICAPEPDEITRQALTGAIDHLGDLRLTRKVAVAQARLSQIPPGELLFQEMMEAFGYSQNREPMRTLATLIGLQRLEQVNPGKDAAERFPEIAALMFGVGGFLPIAPTEAAIAGLTDDQIVAMEEAWAKWQSPWTTLAVPHQAWKLARTRPANHPCARIVSAAWLVANAAPNLFVTLAESLVQVPDFVARLMELSSSPTNTHLGKARATAIAANAVIPVIQAYAEMNGDDRLGQAASHAWSNLQAGESNAVTRRAAYQIVGDTARFPRSERLMQGLMHLDQAFCQSRRCFDCPVASIVVHRTQSIGDQVD